MIDPKDVLSIEGIEKFAPGVPLVLKIEKESGEIVKIELNHTFNHDHIEWFKAGSALNRMKMLSKVKSRDESKIRSCSTRFQTKDS